LAEPLGSPLADFSVIVQSNERGLNRNKLETQPEISDQVVATNSISFYFASAFDAQISMAAV
jgi:hypothetical protein